VWWSGASVYLRNRKHGLYLSMSEGRVRGAPQPLECERWMITPSNEGNGAVFLTNTGVNKTLSVGEESPPSFQGTDEPSWLGQFQIEFAP
jgi:hypothetical protein